MPLRAGTRPSLGKRKPSNYPIEFNIFNTYPINSLLNPINSLLILPIIAASQAMNMPGEGVDTYLMLKRMELA